MIGKLIVSSISVYLIALVIYYYYYSPETFKENIIKFLPLLVFPVVWVNSQIYLIVLRLNLLLIYTFFFSIIFSRKLLSWYFRRKLSKNEFNLKTLKANKKKILEEVMDKEVYKVAKEILEKYAPDQLTKDTGVRNRLNYTLQYRVIGLVWRRGWEIFLGRLIRVSTGLAEWSSHEFYVKKSDTEHSYFTDCPKFE